MKIGVGILAVALVATLADYTWYTLNVGHSITTGIIHGSVLLTAVGAVLGLETGRVLKGLPIGALAGIGGALIRRCIDTARDQGHALVLLVGDEPYYGRFGFRRIPDRQLELPGPVNPDRFLALELQEGALERSRGMVIPRRDP